MIGRTTILLEMSPLFFCLWGGLPRKSVKSHFFWGTGKPGKVPPIVPPDWRGFNRTGTDTTGQKKPRCPMGSGVLVDCTALVRS